ncbi:MAG: hypothetical protein WCD40_10855 [Candidatus Acidiferrales bacterium]
MAVTAVTEPQSITDTGLRRNFLEDLALKILFLNGELLLRDLAFQMHLNLGVVDEIFRVLRVEHLIEVKGLTGGNYRIVPSGQGKKRALELLSLSQYTGPAPVSLIEYAKQVRAQSVQGTNVGPAHVQRAFQHLVVSDDVLRRLGSAIVSGTSVFLYGPTGGGKTSVAEAMTGVYDEGVWIPYAVEVDNQVIAVYDPGVHRALKQSSSDSGDMRWVLCRRPRVLVGGELNAEMLDLQFNPISKFYAAPVQIKANNGILIVDDLGRQRIRPEELLNRWIVPLDRRIDFLTLSGGKTFEIPFDLFVVFSTNLDPWKLADEAFLRRIPNKIRIENCTTEQFHEIFRRVCDSSKLAYEPSIVDGLIQMITNEFKQPLRACFPRDIVRQVCWDARFHGTVPQLNLKNAQQSCRNYFVPVE